MIKHIIELGYLKRGDVFYYKGQKYKINSISDIRDIDNVCCTNLKTKKRKWIDMSVEVEVEE